jgi:hypothetical protein
MKRIGLIFLACVGLAIANPASAATCNERAIALAQQQGGKLISVAASGSQCVIRLLVPTPGGPPVRRTFTVSK